MILPKLIELYKKVYEVLIVFNKISSFASPISDLLVWMFTKRESNIGSSGGNAGRSNVNSANSKRVYYTQWRL